MVNKNFKEAIKIIFEGLKNEKIKWAIIGTTNMALQGIDIKPRDLDIVVKLDDLKKIQNLFEGYIISKIKKMKSMTDKPAWEVKLNINNVEVQVMGEKGDGEYVSKLLANKLIYIKFNGFEIPCFTLEVEAQAYEETNRDNKAELIRDFIKKDKRF